MALTTAGLTNGGLTTHYQFSYDDSLSAPKNPTGPEPARTNQVIAACERDFTLMSGWFGNISLNVNTPILVNVVPPGLPGSCASTGACWGFAQNSNTLVITISLNSINAAITRYLMVSELVEPWMSAQNLGWFGQGTEGSQGEGLSRFLAAQMLVANGLGNPPAGFFNSNAWLSSPRADSVNKIAPTDDGPDAATGCSLLFIYYLFSQLGFSINAIVAAGANTLGGVYRNLTHTSDDPFPAFKRMLDRYFPGKSTITKRNLDNPFPLHDPIVTKPGILWHNSITQETQIWFMNGARVASRATVLGENGTPAFVGPPFSIVGTTDLNRDDTADILWHHSITHETQIWFMNGARVSSRATVLGETGTPTFIGPPFSIVGTSERSRSGAAEILWHHSQTGEIQAWIMNGARVSSRATVLGETGVPALINTPWSIVGTDDFNGDGIADILWHNSTTNEIQIWFMNGSHGLHSVASRATVLGETGTPTFIGPPFSIVGTCDFNRNGNADILWHHSITHETQIWFMNGARVASRATVLGENGTPTFIGPPFSIVGAGVFASELPWAG